MPTNVLPKFAAFTPITITLNGLANAAARQGTIVDNTVNRYERVIVAVKVTLGTTPTTTGFLSVYLIRDNGAATPLRDDNAGAADAVITIRNARLLGPLSSPTNLATGDILTKLFVIDDPGPKWTIAVMNSTGVAFNATAANHSVGFVGVNPEIQN